MVNILSHIPVVHMLRFLFRKNELLSNVKNCISLDSVFLYLASTNHRAKLKARKRCLHLSYNQVFMGAWKSYYKPFNHKLQHLCFTYCAMGAPHLTTSHFYSNKGWGTGFPTVPSDSWPTVVLSHGALHGVTYPLLSGNAIIKIFWWH